MTYLKTRTAWSWTGTSRLMPTGTPGATTQWRERPAGRTARPCGWGYAAWPGTCISSEESSTSSRLRGTELCCFFLLWGEANYWTGSLSPGGTINSTDGLKDKARGKLMQRAFQGLFFFSLRRDWAAVLCFKCPCLGTLCLEATLPLCDVSGENRSRERRIWVDIRKIK